MLPDYSQTVSYTLLPSRTARGRAGFQTHGVQSRGLVRNLFRLQTEGRIHDTLLGWIRIKLCTLPAMRTLRDLRRLAARLQVPTMDR